MQIVLLFPSLLRGVARGRLFLNALKSQTWNQLLVRINNHSVRRFSI
jgi:hypothetical protein